MVNTDDLILFVESIPDLDALYSERYSFISEHKVTIKR